MPGSSQDVDSPPDTDGKPESAAPSQSDTEYWMEVFGEVEISGATPETIQPKKPLDLNQSSDWDTHVKKLMDDLDVDGLSE